MENNFLIQKRHLVKLWLKIMFWEFIFKGIFWEIIKNIVNPLTTFYQPERISSSKFGTFEKFGSSISCCESLKSMYLKFLRHWNKIEFLLINQF